EKKTKYKTRISELESSISGLRGQLSESQRALNAAVVDVPLRNMAEELSTAPELFLEQFAKAYRVEMQDGRLTIISTADSKPIKIAFERNAIAEYLTSEKHPQATTFRAIVITNRASGAASASTTPNQRGKGKTQPVQFGFR